MPVTRRTGSEDLKTRQKKGFMRNWGAYGESQLEITSPALPTLREYDWPTLCGCLLSSALRQLPPHAAPMQADGTVADLWLR
jgi:hypothetical protein